MHGFTKKSIDKYIRNRIKYWIYDLGRGASQYLKSELGLSSEESPTNDDKILIKRFQREVTSDVIVTGGCFTSMLLGEMPNDLDIYIKSKSTAKLIVSFYLNKMLESGHLKLNGHIPEIYAYETDDGVNIKIRSSGIGGENIDPDKYAYFEAYPEEAVDEYFKEYHSYIKKQGDKPAYTVSFMTSNAITLSNGLQIINRFCGTPEEIHNNFDFIHTTNYWTWDDGVIYNEEALRATHEKRLYYFGSRFPLTSIFRLKKFIERGWRISAGEIVKIAYDVSKLDLDKIEVLREQSMGMDSAYFNEVISILRGDKDKGLDRTYLFKVLDLVFNMSDKDDDFLESSQEKETECTFTLD